MTSPLRVLAKASASGEWITVEALEVRSGKRDKDIRSFLINLRIKGVLFSRKSKAGGHGNVKEYLINLESRHVHKALFEEYASEKREEIHAAAMKLLED